MSSILEKPSSSLSVKRWAILLALREPMFMHVATISTNHSSMIMLPAASYSTVPSARRRGSMISTTKLHVRSSSGAISNWKNLCLPSSLKPATYEPLSCAMCFTTAASL